ncbi:hypothetical protein KR093_004899 [Drosophila rubida]|uniref:C3H1-type domain-containing protein n=1 Tax=Drosophila rubida TaxID=30044 RepID=A0AAD4PNP6_9MUSC|nr:hypothetical protein KR093_004899 [Drosophila rubida]
MILENSDKLKDWLSVVLEPLCDADSSALARYVIALLKKDKSDKDLKRIMIEQLDVFLSEETTRFVDRLFDAIASEEYLTMPAPIAAMATASSVAELELDHELDLEAILAAASSPPPPPPKDNVIKPDGNQQQQQINNESSREPASEQQSSIQASSVSATATDIQQSTTGTHSSKPAFDVSFTALVTTSATNSRINKTYFVLQHKTKDSHSSHHQQQQIAHHHHHSASSSSGGVAGGFVRSASPPMRSSGGGSSSGATGGAYAADKENQPRDSRRRRASLRSRSRSRSRSNDRSFRRSRSRDRRINEREKSQRQFRNKSPPGGTSDQRHRRNNNNSNNNSNFDRRRIGTNNNSNSNLDERSQRFGGNKGRHSPRSRSNSPESRNRRGNNVEPVAGSSASAAGVAVPVPPPVVHSVAPVRQRCRDFDEKGYCVRGETCPWDHGINPVVFEGINNSALMMSMREYNPDAPEIWARGGPAGVPGVPGAGAGSQQALPVPPQPGQTSINPFSGNVRACAPLGVPNPADYARNPGQVPPVPAPPPMMPFPFNPTAVTTPLQRQLIPIPVMDGGAGGIGGGIAAEMGKRRFELEDSVAIADVPSKMRKVPINSRLGPRVNPNMQQHNSSLELRKVPRGLNTIAHLNNHFAKFGKIVNIQVSYEGDPEAAIVTFSTHAEANVAYRSTEAVLNNRFIKVFWHNDNSSSGGGVGNANNNNNNEAGNVNVNRKSQYHLHNVPAMPTPNADSAKMISNNTNNGNQTTPLGEAGSTNNNAGSTPTSSDQALASTAAPASMRLKLNTGAGAANAAANGAAARGLTPAANAASIRKKQEEQQKAMHQLANGLRKRKQELLQSYVKQMKTALELVERMDQQDVQRAPTLETIKVLQATIDKLRKDVHADQDQLQAQIQQQQQQQQQQMQPQAVKKTKEQQKKELLDMELELIAQQQEGNDTTAIQKRLEELQRTLSGTGGPGGGAGGGAKAPGGGARKRATFPEGSTRVDRRPKAIVVTGFAAEEADFVLGHFKHFGEISKHDVDREIPQLILSYATRINAEQAVLRGKMYKDKRLQISWAPVVTTPAVAPMGAPADKLPNSVISPLNAAGDKLDNPKQLMQSVSESESLLGSDTLPELRLEDEEEDEESEDRSWRR